MTDAFGADDAALLHDYVERGLMALGDDEAVDAAELCRAHPHLAAAVQQVLDLRGLAARLQRQSSDHAPEPDRTLAGRYRLLAVLGSGAAGTVFAARDEQLQRDVAVKLLHRGVLAGAGAAARFLREAQLLAQHHHQHLLAIHDQGRTEQGELFLVTELLRGQSLAQLLAASQAQFPGGPSAAAFASIDWLRALLPEAVLERTWLRQIVRWIVQLGEGLQAAHGQGVFHRDVKPSNAFVRDDGTAVLLDFGIAVRATDPSTTLASAVVGTPWYMPPEQARGHAEPRPTLDVYGLCATLYHLLTLRAPHAAADGGLSLSVLRDDPPAARSLHAGLPADLQAILDRGLERDPARRYQELGTLLADLRAFLDHRPVSVRPLGGFWRTLRRLRRHPARTLAVTGGIAVVLLLAVVLPLRAVVVQAGNHARRDLLLAALPADLCIEGWPDQRLLVPLAERQVVLRGLDELVELDPADLASRLLRGSERLDAGDRAGAAADFAAVAQAAPSPYLGAVAARYAAADTTQQGIAAVTLADLPAPQGATDCFVAGFHALRARDSDAAAALLSRASDYLPARDLRLLALLGGKAPDGDAILAEASWLEGRYGHPTARTRHAMGAAYLLLKRYDAAVPCCEEALRLRPGRHGPWNNLGIAELRLGRLERAEACLRQAVAIRPWFENSRQMLAQVLRVQERFAEAEREAEQLPTPWLRSYELANIGLQRAFAAWRQRDVDGDEPHRAGARAAAAGYEQALGLAPAAQQARIAAAAAYARAFASDDVAAALPPFLTELRRLPRNPTQLMNLSELLAGQQLQGAALDQMRLFLLDLAIDLAPDDPRVRTARSALQQHISTGSK